MRITIHTSKRVLMVLMAILAQNVAAYSAVTANVQPTDLTIAAWGNDTNGEVSVPNGLSGYTAVSAGAFHTAALKPDGTVVAWGDDSRGQLDVPAGLTGVVAIAAGAFDNLALKSDGTVVAWGSDFYSGQTDVPAGLTGVVQVGGIFNSAALKSDGTVVAWGTSSNGQTSVPSGLSGVTAIAVGAFHTLALKSDGTVVAWGDNSDGESTVPTGLTGVVAIATGDYHSLALKSDGTVVAWGSDSNGQCDVPSGLTGVVAIAAGAFYNLALMPDGTVVAWGDNNAGQTTVPTGLAGVVAIAACNDHGVALQQPGNPPVTTGVPPPVAAAATNIDALDFTANWAAAALAGNYTLLVSTTPDFTSNVTTTYTTGNVTSYQVTGLTPSTIYYYRVQALWRGGYSDYSSLESVTTTSFGPFNPPVAVAATFTTPTSFTANWAAAQYATNYTLSVSTVADFSAGVTTYQTGNVTSYAVAGLSPGTVYYYEVQATGLPGTSANSATIMAVTAVSATTNTLFISPGQTAALSVNASGTGLTYQWYQGKSGDTSQPIGGATSANYTTAPLSQTTSYWALVTYSFGPVDSQTVTVKVQSANLTISAWGDDGAGESSVPNGLSGYVAVAAGAFHTLALKPDGTVVAWGDDGAAQSGDSGDSDGGGGGGGGGGGIISGGSGVVLTNNPGGSVGTFGGSGFDDGIGVTTGGFSLGTSEATLSSATQSSPALQSGGSLAASDDNGARALVVPDGLSNVVAIAAGDSFSLALKSDGTVVAWGGDGDGETDTPSGLSGVVAIAAGAFHSVALKSDGTVVAWGDNSDGQTNVPTGLTGVVAIAAGAYYSMALESDGTVVAWGDNSDGQANVPAGLTGVVAIAAGGYHALAVKADGTVVAWGSDSNGQRDVPSGLTGVVAVAGGNNHSLALKGDGTVVAWGYNEDGQSVVPSGLQGVVAISASNDHSVALTQAVSVPVQTDLSPPVLATATAIDALDFMANWGTVTSANSYQLLVSTTPDFSNGTTTSYNAGDVTSYAVTDLSPTTTYFYRVQALGVSGNSDYSSAESATTTSFGPFNPPVAAAATFATPTGFTANWAAVQYATNYTLSVSTAADFSAGVTTYQTGNVTSYAVAGLSPGTTYYYEVQATGLPGTSTNSTAITVVTTVSATTNTLFISPGQTATLSVGASGTGLTYQWYQGESGDTSQAIGGATSANYTSPPLSQNTSYWAQVTYPSRTMSNSQTVTVIVQPTDLTIAAWGADASGETSGPNGLSGYVAVSAGAFHTAALKPDGTVQAWGEDGSGQIDVPVNLSGVMAIAAGAFDNLALKEDGTVVSWGGDYDSGQTDVPAGLNGVVAIGGIFNSEALKSDGTVVAWGDDSNGNSNVPAGLTGVVAISVGAFHTLALKSDGTVVAWGDDSAGESDVPAGLSGVVAVATGDYHSLALKSDGTVVAWGSNSDGQTVVPAGLSGVVAITAGAFHNLAVKTDGTVVAWGRDTGGQTDVPAGLNGVVAIAACNDHSLALRENFTPPQVSFAPQLTYVEDGDSATLSVSVSNSFDVSYQWYLGASGDQSNPISGATSNTYTTPVLTSSANYWVKVTNPAGSVNNPTVTVTTVPPGYMSWANGLGLSGAEAQLEAKPFADGLSNLVRFAMNVDTPALPGQLPSLAIQTSGNTRLLTLQYRQRKNLSGVQLVAQSSTNLVNWTSAPFVAVTQLPDDDANTARYQASIAVPSGGPVFLRVVASPTQ